jgi:hypothetical protein
MPCILVKDPISKITRAKWTGGVAQVCKVLSSNPTPTEKRKVTNPNYSKNF